VGLDESRDRRLGTKLLFVRPLVYPARVAPLEAIAEVVTPPVQSPVEHTVAVRVELVAAQPAQRSAPSLPAPMLHGNQPRVDSDAMQLTAASTAAAVSQKRGTLAYAAAAKLNEANALSRGVCLAVRA
jgi:hypothetical protein